MIKHRFHSVEFKLLPGSLLRARRYTPSQSVITSLAI